MRFGHCWASAVGALYNSQFGGIILASSLTRQIPFLGRGRKSAGSVQGGISSGLVYMLDRHVERFLVYINSFQFYFQYSREEVRAIVLATVGSSGIREGDFCIMVNPSR